MTTALRDERLPAAILAALVLGGCLLVGGVSASWDDFGFLLTQALIAVALLVILAMPIVGDEDIARLRSRAWISLGLGLASLLTFLLLPTAYDSNPGRTGWIDGEAFWVAGILHLVGLVLVTRGISGLSPYPSDVALGRQGQRYLLLGTLLGAGAYLVLQLAVIYDVA